MKYSEIYIEQTVKANEWTITVFYLVNFILCFGCVVTAVNLITTFWLPVYVSLKSLQGVMSVVLVFRNALCVSLQYKRWLCFWLAVITFLSIFLTAGYLHKNGGVYPRPANMLYFGWRFYTVLYTMLIAWQYKVLYDDWLFRKNKKLSEQTNIDEKP